MVMEYPAVRPRHVLCVVGRGLEPGEVERVVAEAGGPGFEFDREYFLREPDPRMPGSFKASMADVSFTDADWDAVHGHDSVAYVLSPPMPVFPSALGTPPVAQAVARDVSTRVLAVAAALLRSGAAAVKNESSGLAHGRDRWLALADGVAEHPAEALFHATVKRPISDGAVYYGCGMHLLGAPDVEVETAEPDAAGLVDLIDALGLYLLTEPRAREMNDGAGFLLAPDAPRWILHRHECRRYEEDDFFFNPYGYWRLTPE